MGLSNQDDHTRPIEDTRVPLFHHIALPNVEYNEWKRVEEAQSQHSPSDPVVEDNQCFMRYASQGRDHVGLGCEYSKEQLVRSPKIFARAGINTLRTEDKP